MESPLALTKEVYADLPGRRASNTPQATVPPSIFINPYCPDIVIHNKASNAVALLELTCPIDSLSHLQSARSRKLEKENYQLLLSELDRLGIVNYYDTIEMSVLGHYLPISLTAFRNCVNFIQSNFTLSKSQCKRIFDQAAAVLICSSRRIFMARSCREWCVEA